ncbi:MAG TPA: phage portal protein [Nocardioidaceae bacterium]|nr:phage portal protein [Nocardioidaceae bacterium]
MSVLFGRSERRTATAPWSSGGSSRGAWRSLSGEKVTFSTVIGLDAVAAVVGLICDVVYMLPLATYRDEGGVPVRLPSPPLVAEPSGTIDPRAWRAQAVMSWMLWGNAYGLITSRDSRQRVTGVDWLNPEWVDVDEPWGVLGPATYRLNGREIAEDQLLHLPGRYVRTGYRQGLVPLERFRETFGLAAAARNYGARWFGEGAHPSAILQTKEPVSAEQAATIKERFLAAVRGRREPAVLGAGVQYTSVQEGPEQSQLVASQQHAAVAVARALGLLQPEMIGAAIAGSSVTYANREQRAIDFLTFSADPYLVRLEDAITRQLATAQGGSTPETGQYVRLTRDALLRTDTKSRYEAHEVAIRSGWRTPNEVRRLEDEQPLAEGGDRTNWPPFAVTPAKETS